MPEQRIPGFCALCKSRCGSIMVTRDGKLIAQEPNPEHPTGKSLCVKGRAAPEIVYNDDRLLYPMMRTNPKGSEDPGWKRIGWDEALDRTAAELSRIRDSHRAESVVISLATPSATGISDDSLPTLSSRRIALPGLNCATGTRITLTPIRSAAVCRRRTSPKQTA
jgi:anaerobic selenocysteine-containing dehydrogenase